MKSAVVIWGALTERRSQSGTPAPPAVWPKEGTAASVGLGYMLSSSPGGGKGGVEGHKMTLRLLMTSDRALQ